MHGPDQKILAHAAKLYGQVLIRLRDAIEDPTTRYDQSNVSATMALHLYELLCYTSGTGWVQYAGGAGRLIELRGPARHQEWPDHGYFTLMRPSIILQAIVSRKRTFLEKGEWMTVPWRKHPETRTAHQQLLDIMAPCAGLLEDYNAAKSIAQDKEDLKELCKRFVPRYRSLLIRISRWHWTWEEKNPGAVTEVPPDPKTTWSLDATGKPRFRTVLNIRSHILAHEINIYNSTLMLLHHGLLTVKAKIDNTDVFREALNDFLSNRDGQPPHKTNATTCPHERITSVDIANDIVRSVDYYLQEQRVNQGAFRLLVTLRMWYVTCYMRHL